MMHTTNRPRKAAFTLVELLVVIGIIAVLVGILLPTLGRARRSANNVYCQSNLRNMGTAMAMYINNNKGYFPGAITTSDAWGAALARTLKMPTDANGNILSADQAAQRGIFLDKDTTDGQGGAPGVSTTITNNNYSAHPIMMPNTTATWPAGHPFAGKPRRPMKANHIKASTTTILLFDGVQALTVGNGTVSTAGGAVADGYNLDNNRVKATNPQTWMYLDTALAINADLSQSVDGGVNKDALTDNQAADTDLRLGNIRWRHLGNKSANFLFVDGHVEGLQYKSRFQTELTRKMTHVPQITN